MSLKTCKKVHTETLCSRSGRKYLATEKWVRNNGKFKIIKGNLLCISVAGNCWTLAHYSMKLFFLSLLNLTYTKVTFKKKQVPQMWCNDTLNLILKILRVDVKLSESEAQCPWQGRWCWQLLIMLPAPTQFPVKGIILSLWLIGSW